MHATLNIRPWLGWIVVAVVVLTTPHAVTAQENRRQRVLALYVTTPGAAGVATFEAVYQRVLGDALGSGLDFHSEFIDLARFNGPEYPSALRDFLRYKYQQTPPDLILAPTDGARTFVERFRADLFPGVPIVFIDRVTSAAPGRGMTGISAPLDLAGTLDLALTLQPRTTKVFVIAGVSEFDRFYEGLARQQLARFAGRVTLTYLSGLRLADLKRTVTQLPPDSIIYFLTLGEDGAGTRLRSPDVRDQLSAVANAPMYTWNSVGLGRGIVGGRLYSNDVVAERSAELALRVLQGERPESIPILTVDPNVTQLDWRQLRRWGISEIPTTLGATILFRELGLWDRYKAYIGGALALMILETALITGLLVQRSRRRRMEAALRESEERFRFMADTACAEITDIKRAERQMREHQATLTASKKQISDLFGRLIAAQETERTRIARDLHDGVSQRIAGLSIMISGVKRRLLGLPDQTDVMTELATMQRNIIALADEIRQVSHDLHPGLLQHVGLGTALGVFCVQFEKLHPIAVTYRVGDEVGLVDGEIALCLYRIAQEALRNVAKHAEAHRVSVTLTRNGEMLQLSIADDGKGFDLTGARATGSGLGLVSIDERVRLLGGHLDIETQSRGGTRVDVKIPQRPAVQLGHDPVMHDSAVERSALKA